MIFHNHLIMHSLQISSDSPLFKNAKAVTYLLRGAGLARVYISSALRTYLISVRQHGFCRLDLRVDETLRDVASVERVEHLTGGTISVYKSILIRPKA